MKKFFLGIFIFFSLNLYPQTKVIEIPLPRGYKRVVTKFNSFGYFLQNVPLSKNDTVYYYNGEVKPDQNSHIAVLKYDVGTSDLQQCADAVMRLRAEYLYSQKKYSQIHFNFLSDGKPHYYTDYAGNDRTYKKFRKYLNYVFAYANTASLKKELKHIDIKNIQIGDVFIQTGNPYGHAMIVMDMAVNEKTDTKIFLLAESFMPAQSIHIVKNFSNRTLSPWYSSDTEEIMTPYWTFSKYDLYRFVD